MYVNQIEIINIRSIEELQIGFDEGRQAGWHVLIGDNGSGKSSIIKSLALGLIGPNEMKSLRLNPGDWLRRDAHSGMIRLRIKPESGYDQLIGDYLYPPAGGLSPLNAVIGLKRMGDGTIRFLENGFTEKQGAARTLWDKSVGWFSAGFGPSRRLSGGDQEWMKVYNSDPNAAAHLSLFGEGVALTEALDWLRELNYKAVESLLNNSVAHPEVDLINHLKNFLNNTGLLPYDSKLSKVSSDGIFFIDGNNCELDVTQLSDGFRSIIGLTFELVRQLIRTYGQEKVFANFNDGHYTILLPGVVLIDEVDAHLHPTWQTRIGQWFTKVFPAIQFIVTTHSPLVCRASERGSIWQLAAPGSNQTSGEVTGVERDKLIYGNVLDAYGTEVFGKDVTRSEEANDKLDRLAELNNKLTFGLISAEEKTELESLRKVLTTDDTTAY